MARLFPFALVLLLATPRAWPCGNSLRIIRQDARLVLAAEDALEQRDFVAVFEILGEGNDERGGGGWLRRQWPPGLDQRVEELRLRARIGRGSNPAGLVRDVARARALVEAKPDSPSLIALYAEALAAIDHPREARILLEDLAARDLVPDATAWLTLAELREQRRDEAGAASARHRCRTVAKYVRVCGVVSPPKS